MNLHHEVTMIFVSNSHWNHTCFSSSLKLAFLSWKELEVLILMSIKRIIHKKKREKKSISTVVMLWYHIYFHAAILVLSNEREFAKIKSLYTWFCEFYGIQKFILICFVFIMLHLKYYLCKTTFSVILFITFLWQKLPETIF